MIVEMEHAGRVSLWMEVRRPGDDASINNLGRYNGWEEIEVTLDSGVCDIVMPLSSCSDVLVMVSKAPGQLGVRGGERRNDSE